MRYVIFLLGPGIISAAACSFSGEINSEADWKRHDEAGDEAFTARNFARAETEYRAAVAAGEKLPNRDLRFVHSLYRLGAILSIQSKPDEAIAAFEKALTFLGVTFKAEDPEVRHLTWWILDKIQGVHTNCLYWTGVERCIRRKQTLLESAIGKSDPLLNRNP